MVNAIWGHLSYFIKDFHEFIALLFIVTFFSFILVYLTFKSNAHDTLKKLFLSLIFIILSFSWIYSGFEAYFRYRFDQSDSLGFLNVTQRWDQRHVVYNNYQYRDNDFKRERTSGIARICVIGDSNAWGYGIKNVDDRFSNLLKQKLNKNGYKTEVYNFAIPGQDTWNEVEEYDRKDKQFNCDIIVWSYFLNDAEPKNSAGTQVLIKAEKQINPLIKSLTQHSFFFDYLYWRLSSKYSSTFLQLRNADIQQYSIPSVFEDHRIQINDFTKELNNDKIKSVVIIFPFLRYFPNYPATDIHTKMNKVFKDAGVTTIIDLLPTLRSKQAKDLIVNRFDTHPNEYVHKIAADKLYNAITPLLEKTSDRGTVVKDE